MALFLHELSSKKGSSLLGLQRARTAHHLKPVNGDLSCFLSFLLLFLLSWSLLDDLFNVHNVAETETELPAKRLSRFVTFSDCCFLRVDFLHFLIATSNGLHSKPSSWILGYLRNESTKNPMFSGLKTLTATSCATSKAV